MKIEDQITSIEVSKKLKSLGIKQKSIWFNAWPCDGLISTTYGVYHNSVASGLVEDNEGDKFDTNIGSAYSVSEISQMLPHSLKDAIGREYILSTTKDFDYYSQSYSYTWGYYNFEKRDWLYAVGEITPIAAASELLIRILEHSKITVEQVNSNSHG